MTGRFAIYFGPPPGSELEVFARSWLGRDHITGRPVQRPKVDGLTSDELLRMTRSAGHYGFHATLKAPFALRKGRRAEELHQAADRFASERLSFDAPPLRLSALSRWIALTLSRPSPGMDRLAADCVRDFEPFRAALTEDDLARRRQTALTPRQDAQLIDYGYPYIFEDFHFHMTLAGPLDPEERERTITLLRDRASVFEAVPLPVDAIAIYEQSDRDQPFIQTGRFPFQ